MNEYCNRRLLLVASVAARDAGAEAIIGWMEKQAKLHCT